MPSVFFTKYLCRQSWKEQWAWAYYCNRKNILLNNKHMWGKMVQKLQHAYMSHMCTARRGPSDRRGTRFTPCCTPKYTNVINMLFVSNKLEERQPWRKNSGLQTYQFFICLLNNLIGRGQLLDSPPNDSPAANVLFPLNLGGGQLHVSFSSNLNILC